MKPGQNLKKECQDEIVWGSIGASQGILFDKGIEERCELDGSGKPVKVQLKLIKLWYTKQAEDRSRYNKGVR